jgi:hypothetical protein
LQGLPFQGGSVDRSSLCVKEKSITDIVAFEFWLVNLFIMKELSG